MEKIDFGTKLLTVRKKKKLSQDELGEEVGVSGAQIGHYEKNKNFPSQEILRKLASALDISLSELYSDNQVPFRVERGEAHEIPFYDAVAVGGMSMLADQSAVSQPTEMINPGSFLKAATGALRVYGHSMYPKYPSGCIVAFKESSSPIPSVIIWGEDYVIELEERRIIKKVDRGETKDSIRAISMNGTNGDKLKYQYEDIEIPLNAIKRMYMVLGKIELEASL